MKNIQILKAHLKEIATEIRNTRSTLKDTQRGTKRDIPTYVLEHRLSTLTYEFRHHHIAYCELRGKTRLQIEHKNKENNEPNESYIISLKEQYAWSPEEIAIYNERMASI